MYRNHNCGELNIKNVGEIVVIAGWVQKNKKFRLNEIHRFA